MDFVARLIVALPLLAAAVGKLVSQEPVARELDRAARGFGVPWQVTHGLWGALPALELGVGAFLLMDRRFIRWTACAAGVIVAAFSLILIYLRVEYEITECGCGFDWASGSTIWLWLARNVLIIGAAGWLMYRSGRQPHPCP